MVDFFLVLMQAGAGDELQGIKKGVLELADMVAVNKADGEMEAAAGRAAADLRAALHILVPASPDWRPPVLTVSGANNIGLDALWSEVLRHREILTASGALEARRREQMVGWLRSLVEERVLARFFADASVKAAWPALEAAVRDGRAVPSVAAEEILNTFGGK
jgi:LAO/AO transport system kinase